MTNKQTERWSTMNFTGKKNLVRESAGDHHDQQAVVVAAVVVVVVAAARLVPKRPQ